MMMSKARAGKAILDSDVFKTCRVHDRGEGAAVVMVMATRVLEVL